MPSNRREFIRASGAAALGLCAGPYLAGCSHPGSPPATGAARHSLNRQALVRRHSPHFTAFDPFASLSIGNGEFAFTADLTGLQTFEAECNKEFPLCTAAHWGWHTSPPPAGARREDFRYQDYDTYGRAVGYATQPKGQEPLFNWLRQNPHRLHLGRLAFQWQDRAKRITPADLRHASQTLDLWSGLLESRFELQGQPVLVQTCCHPSLDLVAVRVTSPLLAEGKLQVLLAFPYGSPEVNMADWTKPERHATELSRPGAARADFARKLDADAYHVSLGWAGRASLVESEPHHFLLSCPGFRELELACAFALKPPPDSLPGFRETQAAAAAHWQNFWTRGGALELADSSAPEAAELERRIILSQYQTAIHCAGSLPSAETGLLCNSWYGKFHLEMHWWHSVHFTAWNRFDLFERSLPIYRRLLPLARDTAQRQGYRGARWPKMIGPDGHDSPSPVGCLLIWQQPHPIYYAELCYRHRPTRQTLDQWGEIVFESAAFMASYAVLDPHRDQYVLGPPLKTVSENTDALTAINPAFELAYWRFGLRTAQRWRERLGLKPEPAWEMVLQKLSPLPMADGLYLLQENLPDTYTQWNWEHPALVGMLGVQPGDGADRDTMRRTVRRVMESWRWERTWGWDFPMMAMAAARAGEPELAVRALLIDVPKNRYWPNGHNYQRENLTAYLPGNGGLLAATAMMAAGWTDGPEAHAPGFPSNGQWNVRHEGLARWL